MNQKSRIYRTYVDLAHKRYILVTTSKDLHLKLGSLDFGCHTHLVKLLQEEFERGHCSQLLLCFEDTSRNFEEGILITMITEGEETILTLALAHGK